MSLVSSEPPGFALLGSPLLCCLFLAQVRAGGGSWQGCAVGTLTRGTQSLLQQVAHCGPPLWPSGWLGSADELCMMGSDLWLVRAGILAEAGQTFAQVEVSSI